MMTYVRLGSRYGRLPDVSQAGGVGSVSPSACRTYGGICRYTVEA